MEVHRQIIFHGNYFTDFYLEQPDKVQEKIEFVFKIVRTVQNVPKKFLQHLTGTDGLYEIRIEFEPSHDKNLDTHVDDYNSQHDKTCSQSIVGELHLTYLIKL